MSTLDRMYRLPALRAVVLAACVVSAAAVPAIAQDNSAPPPPPPGQGRGGPGGPGMQERQLEMMTRQLNLTPDQVTQIKAIQADGRKQMMALRDDSATAGPDRRAKMMSLRDAEQAKVKAVLTDEQKTKYDAMMERMRERRDRGPGGADGPPPPPPPPPAAQ